jgi:hypothetical protein
MTPPSGSRRPRPETERVSARAVRWQLINNRPMKGIDLIGTAELLINFCTTSIPFIFIN